MAALPLGPGLAACGRAQAPVDDQGRVRIRLALPGPAGALHGGFYQALASGAYGRRGLNVELVAATDAGAVAGLLASGAAELGVADSGLDVLDLVAQGAPVRAVAAYFQKATDALFAPPEPPFAALADVGDRAVLNLVSARPEAFAWLNARLSRPPVDPPPADAEGAEDAVLLGDLGALGGVSDGPTAPSPDAPPPRLLADDGWPPYGALVLAPDGIARDNGQALRAFVAASIEGWRGYLRGDPAAADALILRRRPGRGPGGPAAVRARLIADGVVDGGDAALYGLGAMTAERWAALAEALAQALPEAPRIDVRRAFSTAFLPGRG